MGSVCLSLVPVLRCIGLSRLESGLLLIPSGLEFVFSVVLVIVGRGSLRYVLAAEGFVYLALSILDAIVHLSSTFNTSLFAFRILDIIIGATSFIPIFLFTTSLYLYKRSEFFPLFPQRFVALSHFFVFLAIPAILITNEIGSFIGNGYSIVQFATIPPTPPQIAVGSRNTTVATIRVVFSSVSLAIMAAYLLVSFLVVFTRLSRSVSDQPISEGSREMQDGTLLVHGTGWLLFGLLLSAAEILLGFTRGSFVVFFIRRSLRMLGRACVVIGVLKGPDNLVQFDMMEEVRRASRRQTGLRLQIGNPLLVSSSNRLSQMATVDIMQRAYTPSMSPPYTPSMASMASAEGLPTSAMPLVRNNRPPPLDMSSLETQSQRVTVSIRRGRAPTLILRLSESQLPTPTTIMGKGNRSSRSSLFSAAYSLNRDPEALARLNALKETEDQGPPQRGSLYSPERSLMENFQTNSYRNKGGRPKSGPIQPSLPPLQPPEYVRPAPLSAGPYTTSSQGTSFPTGSTLGRLPQFPSPPGRPGMLSSPAPGTAQGESSPSRRKNSMPENSIFLDRANNTVSPVSPVGRALHAMMNVPMSPPPLERVPESERSSERTVTRISRPATSPVVRDMPSRGIPPAQWIAPSSRLGQRSSHGRSLSSGAPPVSTAFDRPDVVPHSAGPLRGTHLMPALTPPPSRNFSFGTVARRMTPTPSSTPVRSSVIAEHHSTFDATSPLAEAEMSPTFDPDSMSIRTMSEYDEDEVELPDFKIQYVVA